MSREETQQERAIRNISEKCNPYAKECPNRHLWSEGFRAGADFVIQNQEQGTEQNNAPVNWGDIFNVISHTGIDPENIGLK